jgi:glycosyltransferase involved in cell wall biosynthesis
MRILHVVATGMRRGAEMFASDLVRALDGIGGLDQEIAILRGPWPSAVHYDAPVTPMRSNGRRLPGLRMDLATLSSLRGTLTSFRPQIVHAHGGEAFKYTALARTDRRTPIVYRRIGLAPREVRHGVRRVAHAALARRSVRIVAVSETVRREALHTFWMPEKRVITIPNGVDPERLRAHRDRDVVRAELDIPSKAPVVISVGALSSEKEPLALLELCGRLARSMPDVVSVFVGDGPMRQELTAAVRARKLEARVRLLGSRSDVGDLLGASDLLALTSRSEGMPACVIEAGMAGIPVVAFQVAGVPEVLIDGVTGYVVDPGNDEAFAARALTLLLNEDLRREMGRAAIERCQSLYDIQGVARRYADIYTEVVVQ